MEVAVTTGAINRAKLQSNHHHQQTNIQFFTGRMPFLSPTNSVKALKGIISHSVDLLTPSSPGVFHLCLWPPIAPGYLGGGLPCLSSDLWCQYPHLFTWWVEIIYQVTCGHQFSPLQTSQHHRRGQLYQRTWSTSQNLCYRQTDPSKRGWIHRCTLFV